VHVGGNVGAKIADGELRMVKLPPRDAPDGPDGEDAEEDGPRGGSGGD
jgi:hypothetical protein